MKHKKIWIFSIIGILVGTMGIQSWQEKRREEEILAVSSQGRIEERIKAMTIEEKVAQMIMARVPETNATQLIEDYQFGGYVLFGVDFEGKTKEEVVADIQGYQDASKIKMLIGVDEEGGTVNRVSPFFRETPFASPQTLYAQGGIQKIIRDTQEKDAFLQSFGITVNFAPVADVSTNPEDYIYERSFGQGGEETAHYVRNVVTTMKVDQMGSVVKHFPGYGNNRNSHTEIVTDERPISQFTETDFLPFIAAKEANVDSFLVAHNIVNAIDPDNPASLSPKVHEVIRETIGFKGVVMTDDLIMAGVEKLGTSEEIAIRAVLAGNDMLLSSDPKVQYQAVLQAVKDGEIEVSQIEDSVRRILQWKMDVGLF